MSRDPSPRHRKASSNPGGDEDRGRRERRRALVARTCPLNTSREDQPPAPQPTTLVRQHKRFHADRSRQGGTRVIGVRGIRSKSPYPAALPILERPASSRPRCSGRWRSFPNLTAGGSDVLSRLRCRLRVGQHSRELQSSLAGCQTLPDSATPGSQPTRRISLSKERYANV